MTWGPILESVLGNTKLLARTSFSGDLYVLKEIEEAVSKPVFFASGEELVVKGLVVYNPLH